jgi:hypothetical protein
MPDFTARNVAKWLASSIVAMKTAEFAANTVTDYTNFEKDNMVVRLGSGCVGWLVSSTLEPVTDKAVDSTVDFVAKKWEARKARRNTKQD